MSRDKLVDIQGEIKHETERAYLFYDGDIECWLPKSRCEWDEETGVMTMDERLAIEKGLV